MDDGNTTPSENLFAATSTATVHRYAFGRVAPYPWWDLPVLLAAPLALARHARERRAAPAHD